MKKPSSAAPDVAKKNAERSVNEAKKFEEDEQMAQAVADLLDSDSAKEEQRDADGFEEVKNKKNKQKQDLAN